MIGHNLDHYRIVHGALTGERPVDEETFNSLAVLSERLDQLKRTDKVFSGIEFSPDVERLKGRKSPMTIG